jgi:hypothetical protein
VNANTTSIGRLLPSANVTALIDHLGNPTEPVQGIVTDATSVDELMPQYLAHDVTQIAPDSNTAITRPSLGTEALDVIKQLQGGPADYALLFVAAVFVNRFMVGDIYRTFEGLRPNRPQAARNNMTLAVLLWAVACAMSISPIGMTFGKN